MAKTLARRRWMGRLIFTGLSLFVLAAQLIPLQTVPPSFGGFTLLPIDGAGPEPNEDMADPARWFMPDLLLLIALAWTARRPSFAPVVVIAAVFFLSDLLLQRPPGLWTALVLIQSEILRSRARAMRTLPFWLEWLTVSAGIIAITMIYRFTLSMVVVAQAPLGLTLIQLGLTLLAYPAVVFVAYAVFSVSRPAPGEVDEFGHRI